MAAALLVTAHVALGSVPVGTTTPSTLTCTPTSIGGSASSTCTVTLTLAAPSGGASVALSSTNVLLTVPASVSVAAGSTTAAFAASSKLLKTGQSATITASLNSVSVTASISLVVPTVPTSLSCAPAILGPNASSTCTVALNQAAPSGGALITLSSTSPTLEVPASFSVAAGSSLASFTASTAAITSSQTVAVIAMLGGAVQSVPIQLVVPTTPASLACTPAILGPKASGSCIVTLNQAAPSGGASIALSNNNSLLTVPTSVTVAAGFVSGSFSAISGPVVGSQSATVTATLGGVSRIATLGLLAPLGLTDALSLSPGSTGTGGQASMNVDLTSPAGNEPAAIQWTVTYPLSNVVSISVAAGPAATAAGKALSCVAGPESYTCLLSGPNTTIISNGPVAVVNMTMATGVSATPIGVSGSEGSSGAGNLIVIAPSGGVVQ